MNIFTILFELYSWILLNDLKQYEARFLHALN